MKNTWTALFIFLSTSWAAQSQDTLNPDIVVVGKAFEKGGSFINDLLIINQRTYSGNFGQPDGSFKVYAKKRDTLIFGALGYNSIKVCFADSLVQKPYRIDIGLSKLQYNIGEVEIIAPRDLDDIQRDIEKLGYNEKDHRVSGVNALQSPITFLYQQLSRREQSKRKVIEMENNDRRRLLLKELFVKYVDFDIIQLSTSEFDDFITFLNVSDEFMKRSSQYDFILYVKSRFQHYQKVRKLKTLDEGDYNYHED